MKRVDREKLRFKISAARKRLSRHLRNKRDKLVAKEKFKANSKPFRVRSYISAPEKLDLYDADNHELFIAFIEKIRSAAARLKRVYINFQNSYEIHAAAGLLLVAEVDRLVTNISGLKIRSYFPPKYIRNKLHGSAIVEGALKQIGFFHIIGQASKASYKLSSIKKWKQLSGHTADGSLANSLIESMQTSISPLHKRKLYRGAIEAIANCVEHAYPTNRRDGLNICDKRWWMLVGVDDERLVIIVCDLGVGIPVTLPIKNRGGILEFIKSKFNLNADSDGDMILASTYVKRTRTEQEHRGKGGSDFRTVTKQFPTALLSIRSNRGVFIMSGPQGIILKNKPERRMVPDTQNHEAVANRTKSICGTIIEWHISLQDLSNE